MKSLYIFDLDGTLIDSLASIQKNWNNTAANLGLRELPIELFRYFAGDGSFELCSRALDYYNLPFESGEREKYLREVYRTYTEVYNVAPVDIEPFEGMTDVLEKLKKSGKKLAVTTNKPDMIARNICNCKFKGLFDFIIGLKDGVEKKPNPEMVFMALKSLSKSADDAIYFGDTNTDMMTGKNASIFTVGVLWGFRPKEELEEHADIVIDNVKDILTIEKMCKF